MSVLMEDKYNAYRDACNERFRQLKAHEEQLNKLFIDAYGLKGDVPATVADRDVTVTSVYDTRSEVPANMKGNAYVQTKADVVKDFISYAIGCMMGRYSLDADGIILANQGETLDDYFAKIALCEGAAPAFMPCAEGLVGVPDEIIARLKEFLVAAYGEETFVENWTFMAEALGLKGIDDDAFALYFAKTFYKDHCRKYKKRPIYWMFDSGKNHAFQAILYLHRYTPDILTSVRALAVARRDALHCIPDTEPAVLTEINEYVARLDERLCHPMDIDLNDGVKVNYQKFAGLLAPIA